MNSRGKQYVLSSDKKKKKSKFPHRCISEDKKVFRQVTTRKKGCNPTLMNFRG
jgi:hypothetical protein